MINPDFENTRDVPEYTFHIESIIASAGYNLFMFGIAAAVIAHIVMEWIA